MVSAVLLTNACTVGLLWLTLAVRWDIRPRPAVTAAIPVFFGSSLALVGWCRASGFPSVGLLVAAEAALALVFSAAFIGFRFFRDPERRPPAQANAVLSPADGTILYVRNAAAGSVPVAEKKGIRIALDEFTGFEAFRNAESAVIGIGMNVLNVHVNRAPAAGRIVFQHRIPGTFGSLRDPEAPFRNERVVHVIDGGSGPIGVVQIASRLVRRIVTYQKSGDTVTAGQRIGMIRFGSQVDVVIPGRILESIRVRTGQQVIAGESVLAALHETPPGRKP
jgi:phosphatidylserine decarboxylase